MKMDIQAILDTLPHRYPFLLVDRVVELEPGQRILAQKNVTANEEFFNGHFPNYKVMPGVLIIEALAQAAGILSFKTIDSAASDEQVYFFAGIDNARFKRPVVPGDQLMMESRILANRRGVMKFACQASVDGELACSAEIMCMERASAE